MRVLRWGIMWGNGRRRKRQGTRRRGDDFVPQSFGDDLFQVIFSDGTLQWWTILRHQK
jgi:hypothetical protein